MAGSRGVGDGQSKSATLALPWQRHYGSGRKRRAQSGRLLRARKKTLTHPPVRAILGEPDPRCSNLPGLGQQKQDPGRESGRGFVFESMAGVHATNQSTASAFCTRRHARTHAHTAHPLSSRTVRRRNESKTCAIRALFSVGADGSGRWRALILSIDDALWMPAIAGQLLAAKTAA